HAKTYSAHEALTVCKLLVDSPGFIPHFETTKLLGRSVVEEMIALNFLHYRSSAEFFRDLLPSPRVPVLTAPSEPARLAMQELVIKHAHLLNAQPPEEN
ncbi:hypothetical protein PSHT_11777, partial [Puccinia striiformis]